MGITGSILTRLEASSNIARSKESIPYRGLQSQDLEGESRCLRT